MTTESSRLELAIFSEHLRVPNSHELSLNFLDLMNFIVWQEVGSVTQEPCINLVVTEFKFLNIAFVFSPVLFFFTVYW